MIPRLLKISILNFCIKLSLVIFLKRVLSVMNIKITYFIFIFSIFISSCKKNNDLVSALPTEENYSLAISSVNKTDLNGVDISYVVNPPVNQTFSEIFLNWSEKVDFSQNNDSARISVTGASTAIFQLKRLKSETKYYSRLGAIYKGKKIFSPVVEWLTDTLKILNIGYSNVPWNLNKGDSFIPLRTNLGSILPNVITDTKIFIGSTQCPVATDQGTNIYFHIPATIPSGKFLLELRRNGAIVFSPDSVEIFNGKWSNLTAPNLPLNPAASTSGLFSFSTCQSAQKGYMLGGVFWNGVGSGPESMNMGFILEFDPITQQWTKKFPSASRYFSDAITYHYNNSIYVIGGYQRVWISPFSDRNVFVKKMMRLNLANLVWSDLDSMPTYGKFNLTSFELANEWYIGMGADSANVSVCCGVPLPSKKFWKYNPATNQWTQLADFPGGHQVAPTCFSIGSKAYAFYGAIPVGNPIIATNFTQELWEYNPATNAWASIQLPATGGPPPGEKYQITVNNGKAYFITAQRYRVGPFYYYFELQNVYLEWNPVTNVYKRVASTQGEIMKLVYSQNNRFFYQSDALGAFERIPNRTFLFDLN